MDIGIIESSIPKRETSSSGNGLPTANDGTSHESSRGTEGSLGEHHLDERGLHGAQSPLTLPEDLERKPFSVGEIVFYSNRVEFCGADICSGVRSSSRRIVLELLSRKRNDGEFVAYSGEELEGQLKKFGGQGTAAGLIRDLRMK